MKTEIEAKFLDINSGILIKKLKSLNAKLVSPEREMKRKNFDYGDGRLQQKGGWVRLRDEGNKVTLAYKQLNDRTITGTKEVNVEVVGFDAACDFLACIGLKVKSYQETKRESWLLDDVEIEIDTWPWIPQFVELEGKTAASVKRVANQLGLNWSKALHGSVEIAYQSYFNVSEEEIDGWEQIVFSPTPDWLEAKRIRS